MFTLNHSRPAGVISLSLLKRSFYETHHAMLEAKNLTKEFNGKTALKHVSLTVDNGEVFCLLGANGAGKTTLINIFLNFIAPSSGEALIDGISVKDSNQQTKARLAYIPEVVMLYGNLTG